MLQVVFRNVFIFFCVSTLPFNWECVGETEMEAVAMGAGGEAAAEPPDTGWKPPTGIPVGVLPVVLPVR